MARGNRREMIFHDDDDRRFFLANLSEACAMTGWRVDARCSHLRRGWYWGSQEFAGNVSQQLRR